MATLIQQALTQTTSEAGMKEHLDVLSSAEINSQIQSTLQQAIKEQEKQKSQAKSTTEANSKLGFLQKVVTLECFFGGSDCLFRDKQAMMQGKVTEFAKKKFEEGNTNVNQYLTQINAQVTQDLKQKSAEKSMDSNQKKQAELNKQLHDSVQGLMKLNQKEHSNQAPALPGVHMLANTKAVTQDDIDKRSSIAQVPIDEVDAIGVKVSPLHAQDTINSVTLKSFRKIVGYDTFNSILRKERDEKKDMSDYYNVTVSMMIQRTPPHGNAPAPKIDGQALSDAIDKGFPYDDAYISSLAERAKPIAKTSVATMIGQLDGHNISKEALRNLVTDKSSPLTTTLA